MFIVRVIVNMVCHASSCKKVITIKIKTYKNKYININLSCVLQSELLLDLLP